MNAMDPELTKPLFWATHYWLLMGTEDDEATDLVEPLFGLKADAVFSYYEGLVKPPASAKVMSVPIRDGFGVGVDYVTNGADVGNATQFYITHPAFPRPELLGHDSPHFALPAFRWSEVRRVYESTAGTLEAAAAGLLIFPATYVLDHEVEEASGCLTRWWAELEVAQVKCTNTFIQNIVQNRRVQDIHWHKDPNLGWITDGQYSFRNPKTLMCAFSKTRFDRIGVFLEAIGASGT